MLLYEVGVAKRIAEFCQSDSTRPTDRLHAVNVNNHFQHFELRDGPKCISEELSHT